MKKSFLVVCLCLFLCLTGCGNEKKSENKVEGNKVFLVTTEKLEKENNKVSIKFNVENQGSKEKELDSVIIDFLDENENTVGGTVGVVNNTFKTGEKKSFTTELEFPEESIQLIKSLKFRCDTCQ